MGESKRDFGEAETRSEHMTQQQQQQQSSQAQKNGPENGEVKSSANQLDFNRSGLGNTLKKLFLGKKKVEAENLAETLGRVDAFTKGVEELTKREFLSATDNLNKAVNTLQKPFKDSIATATREIRDGVDALLTSTGTTFDEFAKMSSKERRAVILQLDQEDKMKLKSLLSDTKKAVSGSLTDIREVNQIIEGVLSKQPSPNVMDRLADQINKTTPTSGSPFDKKQAVKKATEQAKFEIENELIEAKSNKLLKVLEETKDLLNPPAPGSSTGIVQGSAPDITVEIPTSLAQELEQMMLMRTDAEKQALEDALKDYQQDRNPVNIERVTEAEAKLKEKFEEAHKIVILVADELKDVAPTFTTAGGRHGNGLSNALDEKVIGLKQKGVDPATADSLFQAGERFTEVLSQHIAKMISDGPAAVTSEEIEKTLEQLRKRRTQLLEVEADPTKVAELASKYLQPNSKHRPELEAELEALRQQVVAERQAAQNPKTDNDDLSLD